MSALLLFAALASQDADSAPTAPFPEMVSGSITYEDYPQHSRRLEEEGAVGIVYKIDSSGRVNFCSVEKSSGFARLDEASCRVMKRFKFAVSPTLSSWVNRPRYRSIKWILEDIVESEFYGAVRRPVAKPDRSRGVNSAEYGELPAGSRANIALYLDITPDGGVQSCAVRWSSGSGVLDRKACDIAMTWTYQPATKANTPVRFKQLETFFWAASDIPLANN